MTSHNSSKQDSAESNDTIEQFSIKKYGSSISIVFLLIAIGVLSYFLWECKKGAKVAAIASA